MSFRLSVSLSLSFGLWIGLAPSSAEVAPGGHEVLAPSSENILIIVADDLGVDSVNAYGLGGDLPSTPNIDSLASGGVLFKNAWSNPVCSPTRATTQTGRYALRTGIGWISSAGGMDLAEITLPEMLDLSTQVEYDHALIGKWHLGHSAALGGLQAPNLSGYGHFAGTMANLDPAYDYFRYEKVVDGVASMGSRYAPTDKVDDALDWIQNRAQEPWLCYLAFNTPHTPFHAPPAALHSVSFSSPPTERELYKAMVEAMDTEIGRLLGGLGAQAGRTNVVFLGDNGTPRQVVQPPYSPPHAKGTLYEGGIRVPLLIRGPRVSRGGQVCEALVNTSDIFATVADIAGVDLSTVLPPTLQLDSVSLDPYLSNPLAPSQRQFIVSEIFFPNGQGQGNRIETGLVGPPYCQRDLGYGGPGNLVLSACGDHPLTRTTTVDIAVQGQPNIPIWVLFAYHMNPIPLFGGTITPVPMPLPLPVVSDSTGLALIPGIGNVYALKLFPDPVAAYIQAIAPDPTTPEGVAISNTIKLEILAKTDKAIRDARWKLIQSGVVDGPEELFDLVTDPYEQTDLLSAGPLSPAAAAAYAALSTELERLIATEFP